MSGGGVATPSRATWRRRRSAGWRAIAAVPGCGSIATRYRGAVEGGGMPLRRAEPWRSVRPAASPGCTFSPRRSRRLAVEIGLRPARRARRPTRSDSRRRGRGGSLRSRWSAAIDRCSVGSQINGLRGLESVPVVERDALARPGVSMGWPDVEWWWLHGSRAPSAQRYERAPRWRRGPSGVRAERPEGRDPAGRGNARARRGACSTSTGRRAPPVAVTLVADEELAEALFAGLPARWS